MHKNVVLINPSKIYKENHFTTKPTKTNPLTWIKTLNKVKESSTVKETNDMIGKRLIRIKPTQIKIEIEDLEQENRQIKTALVYVKEINNNLKEEYNQEETHIRNLWNKLNGRSKSAMHSINTNDKSACNAGHLTKNLKFQIYLVDNEIKKTEKEFWTLQSTDEYYQYIENSTLNKVYKEEIDRLQAFHPQKLPIEEMVNEKKFGNIINKIEKVNQNVEDFKSNLKKTNKEIEENEQYFEKNKIENRNLEYHLKVVKDENSKLKVDYEDKLNLLNTIREKAKKLQKSNC